MYFACVEALQNVIRHAGGASAIAIMLEGSDAGLRFEVRDDGPGFAMDGNGNGAHRGSGLVNMHDRMSAVGASWRSCRRRARGRGSSAPCRRPDAAPRHWCRAPAIDRRASSPGAREPEIMDR